MITDAEFEIRKAKPGDGPALAELMNLAGEGLPAYLWSQSAGAGDHVMDIGARRAASPEGGFSYSHAHVLELSGEVAGMLLGYRLPDPYDRSGLDEYPEVVRPAVELEAEVPGSWYINGVAVFPEYRGRGVGTHLMALAEQLARDAGASAVSLIVAEANKGAVRLYERFGYQVKARRPIVPFHGLIHRGDWLLMRKVLDT